MTSLFRLLQIIRVIAKYRLDELIPDLPGSGVVKKLMLLIPYRWFAPTQTEQYARLRLAMEELGPVFIKLGQMLSTRKDLLADDIADDLAKLQDQIPPFSSEDAVAIIEKELGKPIAQLFASFNRNPLASASVAQVHAGTLSDGAEIVVKVIRPDIEKTIRRDIKLMKFTAGLIERLWPELARFHPLAVVKEYEEVIFGELDLTREAGNTVQLKKNFSNSPLLYVPQIYWELTATNVMVMERIYGVRVDDVETLKQRGVDFEILAERGVEIFFTQVFRDNFFHADMHPGNIFVDTTNPEEPVYIAIDCAIVGTLSREERFLLARQLMAVLNQDYEQVALLLIEAGWVPKHTRASEFGMALRTVCDPIFEKPLDQIEFGPILIRLFRTARRFEMQALPQFVLLEKTLLHIEGLGRQLCPELDIWAIGRPLLEQWIREQMSPEAVMKELKRSVPAWLEHLPNLPQLAYDTLNQIKRQRESQEEQAEQLRRLQIKLYQARRKDYASILIGTTAIAGAFLMGSGHLELPALTGTPIQSWLLGIIGLGLVIPRLFGRSR